MPNSATRRLVLPDSVVFPKLTHYLFRYPAKFHPPVARRLIERYTDVGDTILDPFCGSGSLLIEAVASGRGAIGADVDPVAVFVSRVKTHRYRIGQLSESAEAISKVLKDFNRSSEEYEQLKFRDIDEEEFEAIVRSEQLAIPSIPNLLHWFRKYVLIDLARTLRAISSADISEVHRGFLRLCFASIIRNVSNADPVPVSGLEVTAHMKRIERAGRRVNVFESFETSLGRALKAAREYQAMSSPGASVRVLRADATNLSARVKKTVSAVITSPPYHNAVDYYRRHQLEMFWLGMTKTQEDRLRLRGRYIGRPDVRISDRLLSEESLLSPTAEKWYGRMQEVSAKRARSFKHYMIAMKKVFAQISPLLERGSPAVLVVGHSKWNGSTIPTMDLLKELAEPRFEMTEQLWYPVKNRYMSYSRRNGASIDREYVLVFERTNHE